MRFFTKPADSVKPSPSSLNIIFFGFLYLFFTFFLSSDFFKKMEQSPVSKLLERPGSVDLPPAAVLEPTTATFLDLPVELPMLAPEFPVEKMMPISPVQIRVERKKTLFGIYEEPSSSCSQTQIRRDSRLIQIPIAVAMEALGDAVVAGSVLSLSEFIVALESMFSKQRESSPDISVLVDLFRSLDVKGEGSVPTLNVAVAVALLAGASEEERIETIFGLADTNKDDALSLNELVGFFSLVFANVTTRSVLGIMNANGVSLASSEQLAVATAMSCMEMCDLNKDGSLSLLEFKKWFNQPRLPPTSLVPVSPFS